MFLFRKKEKKAIEGEVMPVSEGTEKEISEEKVEDASEDIEGKRAEENLNEQTKERELFEENSQPSEKVLGKDDLLVPANAKLDYELRKEFEDFKIKKVLRRIEVNCADGYVSGKDFGKICEKSEKYGLYSLTVNPVAISRCFEFLEEETQIKVCAAISYPIGETTTKTKVYETKQSICEGADEVLLTASVSALKRGDYRYFKKEINKVCSAARKVPVKVLLNSAALSESEIERGLKLIAESKAGFAVLTGEYMGGALDIDRIKKYRQAVGTETSLIASGKINDYEAALKALEEGADRILTSEAVSIAEKLMQSKSY